MSAMGEDAPSTGVMQTHVFVVKLGKEIVLCDKSVTNRQQQYERTETRVRTDRGPGRDGVLELKRKDKEDEHLPCGEGGAIELRRDASQSPGGRHGAVDTHGERASDRGTRTDGRTLSVDELAGEEREDSTAEASQEVEADEARVADDPGGTQEGKGGFSR